MPALGSRQCWRRCRSAISFSSGEGVELVTAKVPAALAGKSLAQAGIGARFALNVIAVDNGAGGHLTSAGPVTVLPVGGEVFMPGSAAAYRAFREAFA